MTERAKLKKKAMKIVRAGGKPLLEWYAYPTYPSVSRIYTCDAGAGSDFFIDSSPDEEDFSKPVYRVGRMIFLDLDIAKVFIEMILRPHLHEDISA
jgi:hypothetical protein